MAHRLDNVPVLYSVGTRLAYNINERFYDGVHYVWCAEEFDCSTQPPTSNPLTIMQRYIQVIKGMDEHAYEISDNLAGIIRGSLVKFKDGIIDDSQKEKIDRIASVSTWDAFLPVLYVIPTEKVKAKCIEVPPNARASKSSFEYQITNLSRGEYQVLFIEDILRLVWKDMPVEMVPDTVIAMGINKGTGGVR